MRASDFTPKELDSKAINKFLPYVQKELGIDDLPKIELVDTVPGTEGMTFGRYEPETRTVYLVVKGRHPKDSLRTLAHELTHYKQDQNNQLGHDSGATGSPEENEANARAGIIMRNYDMENPEGTVDEHIVKHGSGYRLLSHTGKNLGTFKSKAAAAKHEGEVEYFKSHPKK
jgi:hypothetical protein